MWYKKSYSDNIVWGNDNNVKFFVKANEQKDSFKGQIKSNSPTKSVQDKSTAKKEKLKKTREKSPPRKKKVLFKKETVKNKTEKRTKKKQKPKKKETVTTNEEQVVTKDNFV